MRQPVDLKTKFDFTNKKSVINKIEKDFVSIDVMKNEDTISRDLSQSNSRSHLKNSNEYTSESLVNRFKEKDRKEFSEKMQKIKQKKRLTDYIMVKSDFYVLVAKNQKLVFVR